MKREYVKPVAKLVEFNYEKVMAASCTQGGWVGDYGWGQNCTINVPELTVQQKAKSSCGSGSGGVAVN